jgi:FlaA1/EpsC-like NDP-sugar epimerase
MFSVKIKNINFFSRYIVWAADCLLSVLATSFSFLFFHYLMKVDTDVTTVTSILALSLVISICATWICKTYQGIIRHSSLTELMRIVYAMFIKALAFIILSNLLLEYTGLFIYTIIFSDLIMSVFLLMFVRVVVVNFYYNLIEAMDKQTHRALIYGTSEAAISLAAYLSKSTNSLYNLKGFITREQRLKDYRVQGYPVIYLCDDCDLNEKLKSLGVNTILFVNTDDLHKDSALIEAGIQNNITMRIAPLVEDNSNISQRIQMREVQIEDLLEREEIKIDTEKNQERNLRQGRNGHRWCRKYRQRTVPTALQVPSQTSGYLRFFRNRNIPDRYGTPEYLSGMQHYLSHRKRKRLPACRITAQPVQARYHLPCRSLQACSYHGRISV